MTWIAAPAQDGPAPLGVHGAELVISLLMIGLLVALLVWLVRYLIRR